MKENDLEEARKAIDRIDCQLAELFEERMEQAKKVALYKQKTGLPIFDPAREEVVIAKGAERVKEETVRGYYVNFLHAVMDLSKAYQSRILNGMQVAFSGVPGAFAYLMAKEIFPHAIPVGYPDFEAAYRAVEKGECDVAVLPLENSTNGDVGTVMDLAYSGSLFINGIHRGQVVQNLLAKKGTVLSEIKTVISHPQALGQCREFIRKNGVKTVDAENTALAAKMVAESEDRSLAAIGSTQAAEEYGLSVLASHIQTKGENTTRFAVFSRTKKEPSPEDSKFVMVFTVKHEAGALAKAVMVIGKWGFNLRAIKSRPTGENSWEYYFFCEGDGNTESEEGKKMLSELRENCSIVKVIGSFEKEEKE